MKALPRSSSTRVRVSLARVAGFAAVVVVLAALAFAAISASRSSAQSTVVASYAPFTANITYWRKDDQGLYPQGVTQTIVLQYTDARHWTTTTTANSAAPEYVGSHGSVDGSTATSYDAMTKQTTSSRGAADGPVSVPDRWVVAGIESFLPKKGWTATGAGEYELVSGKSTEKLKFDDQGRPLSYEIITSGVVSASTTYQYQ
jgi:hypothetical protein